MPNIKEAYSSAMKRVNPEGLAISTTVAYASLGFIVPMEAGITYAIHEAAKVTDQSALGLGIAAVVGITNAVSVAVETRTLEKKKYSASPIGSALTAATGKPLASSIGEHIFNNVQLSILNPINAVAVVSNNPSLLVQSMAATSIALSLWDIPINSLILRGKIDPLVDGMRSVRKAVWGRIRK